MYGLYDRNVQNTDGENKKHYLAVNYDNNNPQE
jgi:hypothetical protein